jgi:antitoxin component of RelBE/YafQ-DinJ toxin-antitoxin module
MKNSRLEIRVDPELKQDALKIAKSQGRTISDILTEFLKELREKFLPEMKDLNT